MTSTWPDEEGTLARAARLVGALQAAPIPDALLADIASLPEGERAALAAAHRAWWRRSPLARTFAARHDVRREQVTAAAAAVHELAEVTGTTPPVLTVLARPHPGGVLSVLSVPHRATLALLTPTRGWIHAWDAGHVPVPGQAQAGHPTEAVTAGDPDHRIEEGTEGPPLPEPALA